MTQQDVVVVGAGGLALVPEATGVGEEHRSLPSRSDLARRRGTSAPEADAADLLDLTDGQHFRRLGSHLRQALIGRGIYDEQVAGLVAGIARGLYESQAERAANPFALFGAYTERLLQAEFEDPRVVGIAVQVAADYLWSLLDEQMQSGSADEEDDEQDCLQGRETLSRRWGAGYRATLASIRTYVNTVLPTSLADAIWDGRDADGRRLANSADVLLWLATLAGGGAVGARGGGTRVARGAAPDSVEGEIADIEEMMRSNRRAYNRDEAIQARYRELIAIRDGLEDE
jgi:hypothetical protein